LSHEKGDGGGVGETLSETNVRGTNLKQMFHGRFHSDSISLKLGRTVVSIENWSCIVFGSIRPNEGGAGGYANSRIFGKWKPDYAFF